MKADFGEKEYFEELFLKSPSEDDPWGHNWRGRDKYRFDLYEQLFKRHIFYNKPVNHMKFLDIGCAMGDFTNRLSNLASDKNLIGVDISETAIQKAKKRFPNIDFRIASLPKTGLPKDYFDLITCFEVLYYMNLTKVDASMHEIQRILKNNGKVLFEVVIGKKPYFQSADFIKLISTYFRIRKIEYLYIRNYVKFENIFFHLYQKLGEIEKLLHLSNQELRNWSSNKNKTKIIKFIKLATYTPFFSFVVKKIIHSTERIIRLAIGRKTPIKICHFLSKKTGINKSHIIILAEKCN